MVCTMEFMDIVKYYLHHFGHRIIRQISKVCSAVEIVNDSNIFDGF